MSTRYVLHDEIGAGGMAKVHIARLVAPLGFSRVVAIKRLHPALSLQPDAVAMLVDEARIAARVRHPNVIPTLDVLVESGECMLVMEYVEGESLARLLRASSVRGEAVPIRTSVSVVVSVLHGLHAAHTARSAEGEPLGIMHRDVSPQNILIGVDGVARIFDFGIAKALGRLQETYTGRFKGKLAYVAPERLNGQPLTQRVDTYSASVVLWECLTLQRLFQGESEEETFAKVMRAEVPAPSSINPHVPPALDAIVLRGLSRNPADRFASAEEMALALEATTATEPARTIGSWVQQLASVKLAERASIVAGIERGTLERTARMAPFVPPSLPADEQSAPTSLGATTQNLTPVPSIHAPRRALRGLVGVALALSLLCAGAIFGFTRLESRAVAVAAPRPSEAATPVVAAPAPVDTVVVDVPPAVPISPPMPSAAPPSAARVKRSTASVSAVKRSKPSATPSARTRPRPAERDSKSSVWSR